ncbi:ABC transporter ATP-binding protein [Bradyrhizobium sp. LHD-71]|uniref:ABC transporter ATP-binding protein n=1 Tax=Bradyrhizobium sp. LHD-71 TaxID=3072141 RepID=UPI00281017D3|nr:ABC transporter ATP-binding protein [Bradyrhizobium sp. LHD-71]MDQ8730252.1 ABC transporter ATP-binding protein [Bradyrhizobium sp. LHD-71]
MKRGLHDVVQPLTAILGKFWAVSRGTIALVAIVVFLSSIASVSAPYVFSRLIDRLSSDSWDIAAYAFAIYAILLGASVALQHAALYLSFISSENLGFIAGTAFFERLVKKQITFFIDHNPSEIQSAQASGQQALNIIVQLGLIVLIPGLTQIVLSLVVLGAIISPTVVAIVFVYGAVFIALTYFANKWSRPYLDAAIAATQENAKFVGNAINAMETLRQFGADRWMSERFSAKAREVFENWRTFCLQRIVYAGIFGLALAVQFTITFALLLPRYRAGTLSLGDIVLFNGLLLQLNHPFEMIGRAIDDVVRSYSRLLPFARMWSAPEEADAPIDRRLDLVQGTLRFDHVTFAYEGARGISDLTLEAKRGRITFITGETGAGKSTLFRLALKSIEPQAGRITVDDIDLRDISRAEWFTRIGVVPQDVMLLNDSLATNIVLGRELDAQRLRRATERAAILDFIQGLPEGFDTRVGERGLKLSGGERQRIAIARALYADPEILFLDEASSALDDTTEREIMDNVRALAAEVTVVAITHRTGVIRSEDMIIRLASGQAARQPRANPLTAVGT